MKLSVFLLLLPSVSAFTAVSPNSMLKHRTSSPAQGGRIGASSIRMGAKQSNGEGAWSLASWWSDVVQSATQNRSKNPTAADAYAELKKKVLVKKERQSLEGQLSSLIRIEGNTMSCKKQDCVRRLAEELEALQDNAAEFGSQKTGLTGSWKLIYSSAACEGKSGSKGDRLTSIEDISYVSENYRLSHTDKDDLRVYKRVTPPAPRAASDDTSAAMFVGTGAGDKNTAGRASATGGGRRSQVKQPMRRRMFFGFLRR